VISAFAVLFVLTSFPFALNAPTSQMSSRRSARLSGSSDNTNDSPEPPRVLSTSTRQPGKVSGAKRKSLHDEEDNTNLNGKGKGRSTAAAVPEKVVKKSKKDVSIARRNAVILHGKLMLSWFSDLQTTTRPRVSHSCRLFPKPLLIPLP
jgi:hypothetical protein